MQGFQMGCCYLLKIAQQTGFTNGLMLSIEGSTVCRVYKWVAALYWR